MEINSRLKQIFFVRTINRKPPKDEDTSPKNANSEPEAQTRTRKNAFGDEKAGLCPCIISTAQGLRVPLDQGFVRRS
jgi:hypothetical protein